MTDRLSKEMDYLSNKKVYMDGCMFGIISTAQQMSLKFATGVKHFLEEYIN